VILSDLFFALSTTGLPVETFTQSRGGGNEIYKQSSTASKKRVGEGEEESSGEIAR